MNIALTLNAVMSSAFIGKARIALAYEAIQFTKRRDLTSFLIYNRCCSRIFKGSWSKQKNQSTTTIKKPDCIIPNKMEHGCSGHHSSGINALWSSLHVNEGGLNFNPQIGVQNIHDIEQLGISSVGHILHHLNREQTLEDCFGNHTRTHISIAQACVSPQCTWLCEVPKYLIHVHLLMNFDRWHMQQYASVANQYQHAQTCITWTETSRLAVVHAWRSDVNR